MRVLLIVGALLAGAWYYFKPMPPGKGPNFESGKRVAGVVVQTLESYRSVRGVYPINLDDLVPEYLAGVPHLANGGSFDYQRLGASYKLTFNYTSPLPVHCSHQPSTTWDCSWF